jgi:TPR repeat protein
MGSADAQYAFAVLLNNGIGLPENAVTGMSWLRQAAEHGSVEAQVAMAYRYEPRPSPWSRGRREFFGLHSITDQDPEEAVKWLTMAAENGDAESMFRLSWHFLCGCGVDSNQYTGESWLRKAADQGHAVAKKHVDGSLTKPPYGQDRIRSDKKLYDYTKLLKRAKERDLDALITIMRHYFSVGSQNEHSRCYEDSAKYSIDSDTLEKGHTDGVGGSWARVNNLTKVDNHTVSPAGDALFVLKTIYVYTTPKGSGLSVTEDQLVGIEGINNKYNKYLSRVGQVAGCCFFRYVESAYPSIETGLAYSNSWYWHPWKWHAYRWCLVAAEQGSAEAAKLMGDFYRDRCNKERSQYWYDQAKKQRLEEGQSIWSRLWSSK